MIKLRDILNEIKVHQPAVPTEIEFIIDFGPINVMTAYKHEFETKGEWITFLNKIKTDREFAIEYI